MSECLQFTFLHRGYISGSELDPCATGSWWWEVAGVLARLVCKRSDLLWRYLFKGNSDSSYGERERWSRSYQMTAVLKYKVGSSLVITFSGRRVLQFPQSSSSHPSPNIPSSILYPTYYLLSSKVVPAAVSVKKYESTAFALTTTIKPPFCRAESAYRRAEGGSYFSPA